MAVQLRYFASGMSAQGLREHPLDGRTVVVVDDSKVQRKRLRDLYESFGFRCIGEADNGLDGLQICESLKPDLVSLDILMPVMHGVEAVGYLRDAGAARYIVLVSALADLEEVAKLRPRGHTPDAIFSKKDSRETFREVITNIFLADIISEPRGHDSETQSPESSDKASTGAAEQSSDQVV